MLILKLICCIGGTIILAGGVTAFIEWWKRRSIIEEREHPFYITMTYEDIKNRYDN